MRFEGAKLGESIISNSAFRNGLGMAIDVEVSENIKLINNNVFDFQKYGINIMTSKKVLVDNNWVFGIYSRGLAASGLKDDIGAILACAH